MRVALLTLLLVVLLSGVASAARPASVEEAAVNLAKLRWSGWGKVTATARGIDRGFRKKDRDTAVTVRASGRTVGCKGDWVYTILRVHSRYGTDVVLQPTACP